jgi:hypothetical protein
MNAPIMEIGLDSMEMVKIATEMSTHLGINLPGTLLFDYPTAGNLIHHLEALLQSQVDVNSDGANGSDDDERVGNQLLKFGAQLTIPQQQRSKVWNHEIISAALFRYSFVKIALHRWGLCFILFFFMLTSSKFFRNSCKLVMYCAVAVTQLWTLSSISQM